MEVESGSEILGNRYDSYQASFNKPQMSNFNSTFVEMYKFLQKLYVFFFDVHVQEITFTIISQVSRNWS